MSITRKLRDKVRENSELYYYLTKIAVFVSPSHIMNRRGGSKREEEYWSTRHLNHHAQSSDDWDGDKKDWIQGYWDSQSHPHRLLLIETILKYYPRSVLEVGSNCGPNLFLMAKKLPDTQFTGIDINEEAVDRGNRLLVSSDIRNVKLIVKMADDIASFNDFEFDVVFSDAVLIYIGPDKIEHVLRNMIRVSRQSTILLEWHSDRYQIDPHGQYEGHWLRNYRTLLDEMGFKGEINITPLPKGIWADNFWNKYGAIIEIVKKGVE